MVDIVSAETVWVSKYFEVVSLVFWIDNILVYYLLHNSDELIRGNPELFSHEMRVLLMLY